MPSQAEDQPVLRVGCPMWAHRPWIGTFHPSATPPEQLLRAYTASFNSVEGNTTAYALPDAKHVARWVEQSRADFRFVFKLPQRITHQLRLRGATPEIAAFVERMSPLGERLGPTFIQLPASFGPGDLDVLRGFLSRAPSELAWAVEVRHRDFFAGGRYEQALDEMLSGFGVNRVILDARGVHAGPADTPQERDEIRSKPKLPVRPVATAKHPIVRFIGQSVADANPAFWKPWVDTCVRWIAAGHEPYVFLHTPDNLASPHLALRFHRQVAAAVPNLRPLPHDLGHEPQSAPGVSDRLFD